MVAKYYRRNLPMIVKTADQKWSPRRMRFKLFCFRLMDVSLDVSHLLLAYALRKISPSGDCQVFFKAPSRATTLYYSFPHRDYFIFQDTATFPIKYQKVFILSCFRCIYTYMIERNSYI